MHPKTIALSVTIVSFIISAIFYSVFMSKAKEAKPHKKANLIYMLIASLLFVLVGLSGYIVLKDNIQLFFYFNIHQVSILIFGLVHVIIVKRILPWTQKVTFKWRFLFTLNIGLFGVFFLMISYRIIGFQIPSYFILSSIFWFLVPFFFVEAVECYFKIPDKIYKKWYYPIEKKISDPSDSELETPAVITFRFRKKIDSREHTEFRVKAPLKMEYGRLFYYFINDYNERNSLEPIDFIDSSDKPIAWIFYHRQGSFQRKIYIDPALSIENNLIKENSLIDCIRIKET